MTDHMKRATDGLSYGALCTGLPSPEMRPDQPKSLLLVFLADFEEPHKERLINHVRPTTSEFKILTWHPNHAVLRSIAPQRRYKDSQANLYGLAIVAYRNGHSGFIFADELTKRQVEGHFPLRGEDGRISVGMISVRQREQHDQLRIIAKRSALGNDENIALLAAVENFDISQDFDNSKNEDSVTTVYSELGLELHDPDHPVFTPSTMNSFAYEEILAASITALSLNTPLPPELVLDITSRVERNAEEVIKFPPGLNFQIEKPNINILLGFQTTQTERDNILSILKDAVRFEVEKQRQEQKKELEIKVEAKQKKTSMSEDNEREDEDEHDASSSRNIHDAGYLQLSVHIIPWEQTRTPSRRDILNVFEAVATYAGTGPFQLPYFLMKPTENCSKAPTEFISIGDTEMGPCARQIMLSEMIQYKRVRPTALEFARYYGDGQMELMPSSRIISSGFDEPFYPISHPWNAIGRMNAIPLFFLTNKLSDEQVTALYEEIQTMGMIDDDDWGKKVICPVLWKEDEPDAEDGTPADMWRLYTEVHDGCEDPLFFADLQSGNDLQVIVTNQDYVCDPDPEDEEACELLKGVEQPNYRGLTYGRLPGREAHIVWVNLNIANMGIDEYFDDENTCENYFRPDWPCHDRMDEYNEWIPKEEVV
ncbi:hypothetical protein N7509_008880 [Penicillium cosmopolitanum]|uniref:Uncharacterized protein n=1 Tax=Penicillium cosmopolitanum TaxID=1131564 RepID=A0A9W9VNG2_9EURO|nr:uncharacterized protein N7509_008880 [Penicillium cosmopolitanum]KAJ5386339.1 hypothetical protein N7509_008880 [Penicillium cosmopolitanum]